MMASIHRVLIANRGEIAVRIIRACQKLGLESVLAVSDIDRETLAAQLADRTVCIGPGAATKSYLHRDALLAAAVGTGVDAIHPGYGFLSENAAFAEACEREGIGFVGPSSRVIRMMGDKLAAREIAEQQGVPVVPGTPRITSPEDLLHSINQIGLPAIMKASAGGGGRGLRVIRDLEGLHSAFESAVAEAQAAFGDGTLYLERFVERGRHIEIQVAADHHGSIVHLGERECSLQRRHQKVIEEAPAAFIPTSAREAMRAAALGLAHAIGYENVGTLEFLYDEDRGEFSFLEMNTRIQVEHPVTEQVTGIDLVALQLRVAAGEPLGIEQDDISITGHSVECRITAEAAADGFRPTPGTITTWRPPAGDGIRVDTHCYEGYVVPPHYDPLLAKLVVWGRDRTEALERARRALGEFAIGGIETNLSLLAFLLRDAEVIRGAITTRWLEDHLPAYTRSLSDTVNAYQT